MKTLWMMISTIAVANLLAMLVFVGWLYGTDRLNMERMALLRDHRAIARCLWGGVAVGHKKYAHKFMIV